MAKANAKGGPPFARELSAGKGRGKGAAARMAPTHGPVRLRRTLLAQDEGGEGLDEAGPAPGTDEGPGRRPPRPGTSPLDLL